VSTKYPDNLKLEELLGIDLTLRESTLPDIYIVGLQEVNANPHNVVSSYFKADPWVQKLKDLLKSLGYIVVKTEQMQGLLMAIFVKQKHLYHIRDIESEYTKTGFGGMWVSGVLVLFINYFNVKLLFFFFHRATKGALQSE
jgi:inositol-1,4,5-trisphosphate 5-phosphatase